MHIDNTTKVLIVVFIALIFIAIFCYNKPTTQTRITLAPSVFVG